VNIKTIKILVDNLHLLSNRTGFNQSEIARKAGLGQRTVNTCFRAVELDRSPGVETIESIANVFDLSAGELLSPGLNVTGAIVDLSSDKFSRSLPKTLGRLVEDFLSADSNGQKCISEVAQAEAERSLNK